MPSDPLLLVPRHGRAHSHPTPPPEAPQTRNQRVTHAYYHRPFIRAHATDLHRFAHDTARRVLLASQRPSVDDTIRNTHRRKRSPERRARPPRLALRSARPSFIRADRCRKPSEGLRLHRPSQPSNGRRAKVRSLRFVGRRLYQRHGIGPCVASRGDSGRAERALHRIGMLCAGADRDWPTAHIGPHAGQLVGLHAARRGDCKSGGEGQVDRGQAPALRHDSVVRRRRAHAWSE